MTDRQNYCQLLGLNPLKDYAPEAILKKIEEKRNKWSNDSRNKQNDNDLRFKSERLAEAADDMVRVMSDPALKKKEFDEALKLLKGKCQKIKLDCVILTDGRYVVPSNIVDGFVKKLRWDNVTSSDVAKLAGVETKEPPKAVSAKVENAFKGLKSVDAYTPKEILNRLIEHPNLEISISPLTDASSGKQIRDAFEVCNNRVNSVRPDILPDQDPYIQALRALKLVLEPDSELKSLVTYGMCSRALEPVKETIEQEYTGQMSKKYLDDLLEAHLPKEVDKKMAVAMLQEFCFKKKFAANFSTVDSSMLRCPDCGSLVPAGEDAAYCPTCGRNLKTTCPSCSFVQPSKNLICEKCGFNFKEGIQRANLLATDLRTCISRGRIQRAEKAFTDLKTTFPGYAGLGNLSADLNKIKGELASARGSIFDLYSRQRFNAVAANAVPLKERFPDVMTTDVALAQKINDAVSRVQRANDFCAKAAATTDREQKQALYVNAIVLCPDHPGARSNLRENPPMPPTNSTGSLDKGIVSIKFDEPADTKNVTYCIYRQAGTMPEVTEDTKPLAEVPNNAYEDKSMEPGVEYYYSIYSKRWGILSREGTHIGPFTYTAEVSGVSLEPIENGLRLSFEMPHGASKVRAWRSDGGESQTEIALNDQTVYDDIGLEGGKKFYYLLVVEYQIQGRVERSEGVIFSETTVKTPKPVKEMKITHDKKDGTFKAQWSCKEHVVLYYSSNKQSFTANVVRMDDIRKNMTEIRPVAEYTDGVKFNLPEGTINYIYPIIPLGRIGVRGVEKIIANVKPFRDVQWVISNNDCLITMVWPNEATDAVLVLSDGNVAKDIKDEDAEKITVSRDKYTYEKQICVPMGKSRKKHINLFALYKVNNNTVPSRGIDIEVNAGVSKKIRYTLKPMASGTILSLNTVDNVDLLPPMMLVQSSNGIPLKKTDGQVLWRSNGAIPIEGGRAQIPLDCKARDITLCRLFMQDDVNYYDFRFVHPLYGRN